MPISFNNSEAFKTIAPGIKRRLTYLNTLMVAELEFTNGPQNQPDPPHSHPHEQISYVVEGELFVFIDGEKTQLKKGDMYSIPGNIPHCIQLLSNPVKLIDTFSPIREDFIQ